MDVTELFFTRCLPLGMAVEWWGGGVDVDVDGPDGVGRERNTLSFETDEQLSLFPGHFLQSCNPLAGSAVVEQDRAGWPRSLTDESPHRPAVRSTAHSLHSCKPRAGAGAGARAELS